jgi:hypothetical protein
MLENPITQPEFKMKHKEHHSEGGMHKGHKHPEDMRHHEHHSSEHHHGQHHNPLKFSHVGMAQAFGISKPHHG